MVQLLFPRDPFSVRDPDPAYVAEANAAESLGVTWHLVNFEALTDEQDATKAVRQVQAQSEPVTWIYRGWMLRPDRYAALYAALLERGIQLINDTPAYALTHLLPNWYPALTDSTPQSVWLDSADALDPAKLTAALAVFDGGPLIVKDYVKSQKHRWDEACFIPESGDLAAVARVVHRFLELQGPDLIGGVVFRRFETYEPLSTHSRSGMPLTREYRLFLVDGEPISCTPYWEQGQYDDAVTVPLDLIRERVAAINSRFFTVDVARQVSGEWRIVELGDGQVAGLPERVDPLTFYRSVLRRLGSRPT